MAAPGGGWDRELVASAFDVSHETLERLTIYVELLEKWQRSINLVGPKTIGEAWGRHIADSLQLVTLAPKTTKIWMDLGSGAGLPGLIVAVAMRDVSGFEMHLVEANAKKCAFLQVAARAMGIEVVIHNQRIEVLAEDDLHPWADVISARALAPLPMLLELAKPFMWKNTVCLFHKGQDVESELTATAIYRTMKVVQAPSMVDGVGTILRIEGANCEQ